MSNVLESDDAAPGQALRLKRTACMEDCGNRLPVCYANEDCPSDICTENAGVSTGHLLCGI